MDGRIVDEDGDVLNPFFTVSPPHSPSSYPQNFAFSPPDDLHFIPNDAVSYPDPPRNLNIFDDDDAVFASASQNYPAAAPRVFDRFDSSSSASDENDEFYSSDASRNDAVQKRLDYMMDYLDRKLSVDDISGSSRTVQTEQSQPLPEFTAEGGGTGIFRLPVRSAVNPHRPPSLELRPHPLRERQVGRFLRKIVCVDDGKQLWAGSECGLRSWELVNLYGAGAGGVREEVENEEEEEEEEGDCEGFLEEDAVPYVESVRTAGTLCVVGDDGNRVVWSGHKDGKIRCWKMDVISNCGKRFTEVLSWQAHRGPVLSMVMTSHGDLWSGFEGGIIKIWPWEAIEKSLSLKLEERHVASLSLERSYVDLRSQVTLNGNGNSIFANDVKFILSDHSRARVWTAGHLSFAIWDSRTRELLKVFNIDGQTDNMSIVQDSLMEEELRLKFVSGSKKDRPQNTVSFFQRSRNAILGAADAVRRAAVKGAFGEDNRRTEALVATVDGMVWTGCANGSLVLWDGNGSRVKDFHYHFSAVQSLCTFGSRILVGYSSGTIQVLNLDGNLVGGWVAHRSPVIDLAVGEGYFFSLANHGGIRGWNITSPGPLDKILHSELSRKDFLYTRMENLKILAGTWNVGQGRATYDSLISWLGSAAVNVDIVVVGLQEVEMGAGFLAMSAAKETVGLEGSAVGQWWLDMIGKTLDEGSTFVRIGSRQLAGLIIAVWIRKAIRAHVGDIDVAAVPCGFGRAIGNKGAVGLRMRVYGRIMCFVNCHFAAHLEAVNRRNEDFDHVYRTMVFTRPSNFSNATAGVSSTVQVLPRANATGINSVEPMPELSEADMVVFLGDLNYRLYGISYDEARDFISQRSFDWLREKDQLRAEMESGNVFQGMREAVIKFPPTYKFEKHQAGLAGYDSGEKKRIPAWCDRILYRDSRSHPASPCSLDCPVASIVLLYEACMDVTDSDHKPVRCIFSVEIARIDESVRRQEFGEIIKTNEKIRLLVEEMCKVPEAIMSTNNIILQNQDISILRITNKSGKSSALVKIICEGQSIIKDDGQASDHIPRGSFGFPRWLKVSPAAGIMKPHQIAEISIHHEEFQTLEEFVDGTPQNWWCEDARDKEVILVVKVHGSFSTDAKSHRIRLRHSITGKIGPMNQRDENSRLPTSVLYRSNIQHLSGTSDIVDQLKNLQP